MGRVGTDFLAASLALAACAGPAASAPVSTASSQASSACAQGAQQPSPWREMTWAEYYADVSERAARRNVEVIWVTPPDVREARRAPSSATPTGAPSAARTAACPD